jgi:hypothetical protein
MVRPPVSVGVVEMLANGGTAVLGELWVPYIDEQYHARMGGWIPGLQGEEEEEEEEEEEKLSTNAAAAIAIAAALAAAAAALAATATAAHLVIE